MTVIRTFRTSSLLWVVFVRQPTRNRLSILLLAFLISLFMRERREYAGEPSHSSSAIRVGISAPGRLSLHRLYHQRRRQFLHRHARPLATRIVVFLSIWQIVRSVIVGYAASWSVAWRCRTPGFSATWTSFSTTLLVLTCRDDRWSSVTSITSSGWKRSIVFSLSLLVRSEMEAKSRHRVEAIEHTVCGVAAWGQCV